MAIAQELLACANRYDHWKAVQEKVAIPRSEAENRKDPVRARYGALRQLDVNRGLFLESIIEGNDLTSVSYFERGKLASRPVGRIHIDLGERVGQGFATGFLVAPGLLLTNHHVLPSADVARAATVTFDAEDGMDGLPKTPQVFRLEPRRIYLSDPGLDFCFVSVAETSTQGARVGGFGYLRLHPKPGKILRDEYATIIQHPRGRQKQVAVRNNKIIVYVYDRELDEERRAENNHLYYETDTLPGSSGAPVFSDQWYVVALHRRGVPEVDRSGGQEVIVRVNKSASDADENIKFVANEGVRISRIVAKVDSLAREAAGEEMANARQVLSRIEATLEQADAGPFWMPTASANRLSADGAFLGADDAPLEVTRRSLEAFQDAPGFDVDFLGIEVGLPTLGASLKPAAARRIDTNLQEYLLPFRHFTTAVHAQRRMPIFAAVNIDGAAINPSSKPRRPQWSYDPRLDETHQPDDSIFSDMVQRGHMAAREFMWWGADAEAKLADIHSFTLSNVCPQMASINGRKEWYKLERLIMKTVKEKKQKVDCFMGPVFSDSDPLYDDLRGPGSTAEFGTGIRMPLRFWYVLAWRSDGAIKHRCFLLDQSDDIEEAGPLEFDFEAPVTVTEVKLAKVKELTKLSFPGLG